MELFSFALLAGQLFLNFSIVGCIPALALLAG